MDLSLRDNYEPTLWPRPWGEGPPPVSIFHSRFSRGDEAKVGDLKPSFRPLRLERKLPTSPRVLSAGLCLCGTTGVRGAACTAAACVFLPGAFAPIRGLR